MTIGLTLAALTAGSPAVEIRAGDGGKTEIVAERYRAILNREGNPESLRVGDFEFLRPPAARRDEKAEEAVVRMEGATVEIQRGSRRIVYRFEPDAIHVDHEGGPPDIEIGDRVIAMMQQDGTLHDAGSAAGDFIKFFAQSEDGARLGAIELTEPSHVLHRRVWPSRFARDTARETRLAWTIRCGAPFQAAELVAIESLDVEPSPRTAPRFALGETPTVYATLRNWGLADAEAALRIRATDHHTRGKTLLSETRTLRLAPGAVARETIRIPIPEPGFVYLTAEIMDPERVIRKAQLNSVYAADQYRPPLTRPKDFNAFWTDRLAELRATPPAFAVEREPAGDTETHEFYRVEFAYRPDQRVKTGLLQPRAAPPPWTAHIHFMHEGRDPRPGLVKLTGRVPPDRLLIMAPMPNQGKFESWNSREDNEMLNCYLIVVRILDYLAERDDVRAIRIHGASRSGPLALVPAALAPRKVELADAHVPTSMGVSWTERPYRGWGAAPRDRLDAAAYMDPVNFAPDMKVPFIMDGGLNDGLSPAQGMLAFHNYAEQAPWKRLSIERGGHGYFKSGEKRRFSMEFEAWLTERK